MSPRASDKMTRGRDGVYFAAGQGAWATAHKGSDAPSLSDTGMQPKTPRPSGLRLGPASAASGRLAVPDPGTASPPFLTSIRPEAQRGSRGISSEALKILHGIAALDTEKGGPSACVTALCDKLACIADRVTLLSTVCDNRSRVLAPSKAVDLQLVKGYHVLGSDYSPAMRAWLRENGCKYDVMHSNGMWLPPNLYLRKAATEAHKPLIISPHGMLQEAALQRSSWKKRIARRLYEDANLRAAACFHATSPAELQSIRDCGLRQPVAVIPHGVSLDEYAPPSEKRADPTRNVVFLGRLHPHKGLETLLRAWTMHSPGVWKLLVAGNGPEHYRKKLQAEIEALNLQSSVRLCGPVYGETKSKLLADAQVLVLPSKSENFGLVVAEALACGTPVIATKGAPWRDLVEWRCGWWIDVGVAPLAEALKEAMSLPPEKLGEMGQRGRQLIETKYRWDRAARQMIEVYQWLLDGGDKPKCVMTY